VPGSPSLAFRPCGNDFSRRKEAHRGHGRHGDDHYCHHRHQHHHHARALLMVVLLLMAVTMITMMLIAMMILLLPMMMGANGVGGGIYERANASSGPMS
jgi:hypothetical protein